MRYAVALIPGFLGFDYWGGRTYFADRFIAGLRAAIEARTGTKVPVVTVSTGPIDSLATRQRLLVDSLDELEREHPELEPAPSAAGSKAGAHERVAAEPVCWHLVGHSTGGVDAELLTRTHPLADGKLSTDFDTTPWRRVPNIGSVTTLAAPLYGTYLARSSVALAVSRHVVGPAFLRDFARLGRHALDRDDWFERLRFFFGSAAIGSTGTFLLRLLLDNALARDLDPLVAGKLAATNNRRNGIPIFSFVTVTPRPGRATKDGLFQALWQLAAEDTHREPGEPVPPSFDLGALPVIGNDAKITRPIEPRDSDGVVTTMHQFLTKPVALVVADHADIIGRYRREDYATGKPIDPGLLTSDADFGDAAFFDLIDEIAIGIESSIKKCVCKAETATPKALAAAE